MTEIVELGTRDDANTVRDDHADHLTGRFDRRFAKVELVDDVPDDVEAEIRGIAADGQADRASGAGHVELTDGEKRRVGPFSGDNNYRKATAIKAAFLDAGIDDWEAHYDAELTTDENTGRIEEVRQQQTGADVSDGPTEQERLQKEADAAARVDGEGCDHARDMCQHGNADACEHLTTDCGADETEVSSLLDFAEAVPYDHLDGETKGSLSRSWSGYKVSVKRLAGLLDEVEREFRNAERAAAAIDAIEEGISDANTERFKALEGHHRALLNLYGSHDDRLHGQPGHGRDPTNADLAERAPEQPAVPERPDALGGSSTNRNTSEQLLRDDRHVDDPDPEDGLGRFGVEADEGRDGPSEDHRRAQNNGYVRSGSRGFDDDASAREGLGQFAATGGEETLDSFSPDAENTPGEWVLHDSRDGRYQWVGEDYESAGDPMIILKKSYGSWLVEYATGLKSAFDSIGGIEDRDSSLSHVLSVMKTHSPADIKDLIEEHGRREKNIQGRIDPLGIERQTDATKSGEKANA